MQELTVIRTFFAAACVLLGLPASAQTGSDCDGRAFPLRSYPQGIVEIVARHASGDPLNTVVGRAYGRCLPYRQAVVYVCGRSARQSRSGYLDQARDFYGEYTAGDFRIISQGPAALDACARNVLMTKTGPEPKPSKPAPMSTAETFCQDQSEDMHVCVARQRSASTAIKALQKRRGSSLRAEIATCSSKVVGGRSLGSQENVDQQLVLDCLSAL